MPSLTNNWNLQIKFKRNFTLYYFQLLLKENNKMMKMTSKYPSNNIWWPLLKNTLKHPFMSLKYIYPLVNLLFIQHMNHFSKTNFIRINHAFNMTSNNIPSQIYKGIWENITHVTFACLNFNELSRSLLKWDLSRPHLDSLWCNGSKGCMENLLMWLNSHLQD